MLRWQEKIDRLSLLPCTFIVKSGRNSGTGTGIPDVPAKTAGVNTADWNWIFFCAFFLRLSFKTPGRQHENRGTKITMSKIEEMIKNNL
jgi:hypothetical protein